MPGAPKIHLQSVARRHVFGSAAARRLAAALPISAAAPIRLPVKNRPGKEAGQTGAYQSLPPRQMPSAARAAFCVTSARLMPGHKFRGGAMSLGRSASSFVQRFLVAIVHDFSNPKVAVSS